MPHVRIRDCRRVSWFLWNRLPPRVWAMTTAKTLNVISASAHVARDLNTNNLHDATAAIQHSHCSSSPYYRQHVNFVDIFILVSRIHRHASHTRGRSAWKCYAKTPCGAVLALPNSRLSRFHQATYNLSLSDCERFLYGHSNRRRDFSAILGFCLPVSKIHST